VGGEWRDGKRKTGGKTPFVDKRGFPPSHPLSPKNFNGYWKEATVLAYSKAGAGGGSPQEKEQWFWFLTTYFIKQN
jgi:hypothetical protein